MSISRATSPRASLLSDLKGVLAGAAAGLWPGRRAGQHTHAIVRGWGARARGGELLAWASLASTSRPPSGEGLSEERIRP